MSIKLPNLRKFTIIDIPVGAILFFTAKDWYDNSEQMIYLTGKQRMYYLSFKVDDIIYALKARENKWWLVSSTQFKTKPELLELKMQ